MKKNSDHEGKYIGGELSKEQPPNLDISLHKSFLDDSLIKSLYKNETHLEALEIENTTINNSKDKQQKTISLEQKYITLLKKVFRKKSTGRALLNIITLYNYIILPIKVSLCGSRYDTLFSTFEILTLIVFIKDFISNFKQYLRHKSSG